MTIAKPIYEEMIKQGNKTLPKEACGILSGKNTHIQSLWPLENEVKSHKRFFVSKSKVEDTIRQIKLKKEQVIAIYHTHPVTKPIPSQFDITHHVDNSVKMVIISYRTKTPITKCYQVTDVDYEECLFIIEPSY